ncbi:hypothetical protein CEXT_490421 [Caerostris extrusa]|uniref:Uncharacterized protein n=1 Tax=Caerostris extrusa TaxID=172846 RepID=A0AAV4XY04_CAEEX|nr:hypothetical protein CEXT_490421 [Caerostris extrusa]
MSTNIYLREKGEKSFTNSRISIFISCDSIGQCSNIQKITLRYDFMADDSTCKHPSGSLSNFLLRVAKSPPAMT